jgi:integrase
MEIIKMLEKADERERVVILLMASTGMRVGALPSLKIRNLERIEKYQLYKITVYENEKEEYVTYCTPECARAIDSYLEFRQRHGEHPLNEDSPLVREEFDIYAEIKAAEPKTMDTQAFKKMIRRVGIRSGVMQKQIITEYQRGPRRPVKETHGFRKFFQTTSIGNGMSPIYSELLMGHSSGGLALESYVRPSENDLLEGNDKMIGYVGVLDALTISNEHRLTQEIQTLRIEKSELELLKEKVAQFDKVLGLT